MRCDGVLFCRMSQRVAVGGEVKVGASRSEKRAFKMAISRQPADEAG